MQTHSPRDLFFYQLTRTYIPGRLHTKQQFNTTCTCNHQLQSRIPNPRPPPQQQPCYSTWVPGHNPLSKGNTCQDQKSTEEPGKLRFLLPWRRPRVGMGFNQPIEKPTSDWVEPREATRRGGCGHACLTILVWQTNSSSARQTKKRKITLIQHHDHRHWTKIGL